MNPETQLSEEEVKRVLERAVSLERGGLTIAELRNVATEAGIDANAVSIALSETLAARGIAVEPKRVEKPASLWSQLRRPLVIGATSFLAGALVFAAGLPEQYGSKSLNLLCTAAMCLASYRFVRRHAGDDDQGDLQVELLTLWAAYGIGYSVIRGSVWDDLAMGLGMFWFGSAIVGSLIINLGRWKQAKAYDAAKRKNTDPIPANPTSAATNTHG